MQYLDLLGKAHHLATPPWDGEGDGDGDGDGDAGTGAGAGGSGSDDITKLLATPEMQAVLQKKIDEEVAGLKKKNSELIEKQKTLKENMAQFEGLDVERIKAFQKQIEENEEMKLLSEGKIEEVVDRRTEAMRKDFTSNLTARDAKIEELSQILKKKEEDLTALVVDGQIRESYIALDFEPTAMDDIITLGRKTFVMDYESGQATPRDQHGNIIFSKDGKTPIGPAEWLENLSEKKPYLRRASSGAGASGSGGRGNRGDVDTSKMSPTQLIAHGLEKGLLGK